MARYFNDSEFRKCSPSCSIDDMDPEFMATLDRIREKAGIPLVLNSAYRSSAYDKSKGRSGTGAHTEGRAVDIRCNTDSNRYKIITAALACGVTRIGIGKTYIHIDTSRKLSRGVVWHYYG